MCVHKIQGFRSTRPSGNSETPYIPPSPVKRVVAFNYDAVPLCLHRTTLFSETLSLYLDLPIFVKRAKVGIIMLEMGFSSPPSRPDHPRDPNPKAGFADSWATTP